MFQELTTYLEKALKSELVAQKHNASGELINSIKVAEKVFSDHILIEGRSVFYGKFVDSGRKSGVKRVPIFALEQWVKQVGIEQDEKKARQIAFAIQANIYKKGIPSKPYDNWSAGNSIKRIGFVSETLSSNEDRIMQLISKIMFSKFESEFKTTIKTWQTER
jgi:hypothetical protein